MRSLERINNSAQFILNRLLIVFFFGLLIIYGSREVADLDLWLHLKTGEVIVRAGSAPLYDIFSYTLNHKSWVNHEWFFQVLVYISHNLASFDGIILLQNIVIIATFLLLLLFALNKKNHVYVFTILYLTLQTVAYRFTIRPDIFSLFFLALYLSVIQKFVSGKRTALWLLPLTQVLWVNIHGFAFTGPAVILTYLCGELIKRSARLPYDWKNVNLLTDRQLRQLFVVFLLSLLAFFINPAGLNGAAYPLSVLGSISGKGKMVFQYIQELAKPITFKNIFSSNDFSVYKFFILISLFSFRMNLKKINISDLILWALFLGFSLLAIRNVAYFSIVAAFMIFVNIQGAEKQGKEFILKRSGPSLKTALFYAMAVFLFYYPFKGVQVYLKGARYNFDDYTQKSFLWGISEDRYPKKAVDFLLSHKFPEIMFNDFNSGSYLIGRAYPKRRVFIDGRTELYGPDFFSNYIAVGEGKKDAIEKTIKKYALKGFFLTCNPRDVNNGLLKYLAYSAKWKTVYFDESAIIFLEDNKENAELIKKYKVNLKGWRPIFPDLLKVGISFRYPSPYLARARFLDMLGFYKAAFREAKIVLSLMPNNAEALKYASVYYLEERNFLEAYKNARNSLLANPNDLEMRTKLALIYYRMNEQDKAMTLIDSILKKSPKYAYAYYTKALIIREKNIKKGKELLNQAIKILPKNPAYHNLLGDLLAQENNKTEAKKEWGLAFEYDGSNEEIKKKLGIT